MKLYLIDWGKDKKRKNRYRFGIIEAADKRDVSLRVDAIDCPTGVKAIEINNSFEEGFYVDISDEDGCHFFNDAWDDEKYTKDDNWEVPCIYDTENRKEWFDICDQ
jgi:hypothetical protein